MDVYNWNIRYLLREFCMYSILEYYCFIVTNNPKWNKIIILKNCNYLIIKSNTKLVINTYYS